VTAPRYQAQRGAVGLDRSFSTPGVPLTAFSMGRVTRISTCSGVSPTASVYMLTWGGANFGKTSSLASPSAYTPTATRMHASAITMPRKRIEKRMIEACGPDGATRVDEDN
jgi:hypothetical protein